MNSPNPVPGLTPSGSTVGSGIGGSIAIIVISILETYHPVSGALAAAITTLCAALAGYLPASGRR